MSHEPTPPKGERLQRVIAAHGVASRRAAENLIIDGRVTVNGKVVTELGVRVDPIKDAIRVNGRPLPKPAPRYIVLNKPSGFITTTSDERQRWTVMDLVKVPERVYPVGRLDRDTQGLLLLTNDGEIANRVMHPRFGITKEYHVLTPKRPTDEQLADLRAGLLIEGRLVVPDECRILRETSQGILVRVVIHEGIHHVIREMMRIVGIDVAQLKRERLGPLMVRGIPPGAWRDLTPGELGQLFEAVGMSSATAARAYSARKLQLEPVGGFVHGTRVSDPSDRPISEKNPESIRRERQPDVTRSPASHRDRRPRGSR